MFLTCEKVVEWGALKRIAEARPSECIDYVILQELCHLVEANHGPRFEKLMDRLLPDWRERREKLNTFEF